MNTWRPYVTPCLLLVIPILALNLIFAPALPAPFQAGIFWAEIPAALTWPENIMRVALFALTAILPLRLKGVRFGWVLFLFGLAAYGVSWAALIHAPASIWSTSILGFTAPAWTPALWLAGMGLIAGPPVFASSQSKVWNVAYWLLAAGFLSAHIAHTLLVFSRLP